MIFLLKRYLKFGYITWLVYSLFILLTVFIKSYGISSLSPIKDILYKAPKEKVWCFLLSDPTTKDKE